MIKLETKIFTIFIILSFLFLLFGCTKSLEKTNNAVDQDSNLLSPNTENIVPNEEITKTSSITLVGNGDVVTDEVFLEAGLNKFVLNHLGKSNFIIHLLDEEGNVIEYLSNETGVYTGQKAIKIKNNGKYLLEITADGNWSINFNGIADKLDYYQLTTTEPSVPETIEITDSYYNAHGLDFNVILIQNSSTKISYINKSGETAWLSAQDGKRLLKFLITIQCKSDNCSSFYTNSLNLLGSDGITYEQQCPINVLNNCLQRDELTSLYDPLNNQKTFGDIIFSVPTSMKNGFILYRFSYGDNPKNLKFVINTNQ